MRVKTAVLALVVLLANTGCFAKRVNSIMRSWQGHHYSELIMSWGPPQAVYNDGQGGRILVWTAVRQWTTPGTATTTVSGHATVYDNYIWGQARALTEYRPPQTHGYTAWRMFRINQRGMIYSWSWRGL